MGRPINFGDVKYIRLNKRNFEDRLLNNDSGLLVYAGNVFHNAYYDLDDTICFEDGTTVTVNDLYDDMVNGDAEVYAIIGTYPDAGDDNKIPMLVSYDEIVDKIIEDEDSEEEY